MRKDIRKIISIIFVLIITLMVLLNSSEKVKKIRIVIVGDSTVQTY